MTEPSEDAKLLAQRMEYMYAPELAIELQTLMDERDAYDRDRQHWATKYDAAAKRAEAAEEKEAHFACLAKASQLRAEAAEASKAQLIREVRELCSQPGWVARDLAAILNRHEKDGS